MYQERKLKNGTRLITQHEPHLNTVTMMVFVRTGASFEGEGEKGIAHFLEHMCFKDTKNYTKEELANTFEECGAAFNAYTMYECTTYYAKVPSDKFVKIFPLLSEIYHHPQFPKEDIEIEKGVVIGEINMYKDMPQSDVFWKHMEALYGAGNPHGDSILGTAESVSSFTQETLKKFHDTFYHPANTTIVVAGNFEDKDLLSWCEDQFVLQGQQEASKLPATTLVTGGVLNHEVKKTEQTHIVYSYNTESLYHPDGIIFDVLAAILGQGLSSRLFVRLREKMGSGYYVNVDNDETYDSGAFMIATGTEHSRVEEIVLAINDECQKIIKELVSDKEFRKVKDMMLSRYVMRLESSNSIADYHGLRAVLGLTHRTKESFQAELEKITQEDIQRIAQKYFVKEGLALTVVGPEDLTSQLQRVREQLFT